MLLGGCSINDDLREFRNQVPDRIAGLAWLELAPLGEFAPLLPVLPEANPGSLAAQAAALRIRAAALRGPVLEPARARAMRTALRRAALR